MIFQLPSLALRLTHESLQYKKPMEIYFKNMKINEQNYNSKQISVV